MATRPRNRNKATTTKSQSTTTQVVDDSPKVATTTPPVETSAAELAALAAEDAAEAVVSEEERLRVANETAATFFFNPMQTAAQARMSRAVDTTAQLQENIQQVENASDNPGLDKILGNPTNLPTPSANRPAIFDLVDKTLQPFVEEMMPNASTPDARAAELHYSMYTLIKYLLNIGGNEMKVGVPYLFSYYRKYKGSVFHPQNHHRGVGLMRGSESDIDFYRNLSRLFVDISSPEQATLVLKRTDVARFRTLTLKITSPAAQKMSENLVTLISRVHTV